MLILTPSHTLWQGVKPMANTTKHWHSVWRNKDQKQLSWYQKNADLSISLIQKVGNKNAKIIDVGAGASTLVDGLLNLGFGRISLVEISEQALDLTQKRLGDNAAKIQFINQNILHFEPKTTFDIWHDRAVFHFLTASTEQQTYIKILDNCLKIGGHFILATFAPSGPKQCSNLEIVQYDQHKITNLLPAHFELIEVNSETHKTPDGSSQDFNYFCFLKT